MKEHGIHMILCRVGMVVVLLLSFSMTNVGQDRIARFQHLTIEDGLPQNMVDCILQDSRGFMWFGTWNGLCKFDGYNFEIFNNENSQLNNFIHALYEDDQGNIWIGTKQGLYVYIYNQRKFVSIDLATTTQSKLSNIVVNTIIRGTESTGIVGTNNGVYYLCTNGNDGKMDLVKYRALGNEHTQIKGNTVNTLLLTDDHHLWVGTDEGISVIDPDGVIEKTFVNHMLDNRSISADQILKIFQSEDGSIWVGTDNGLNLYDRDNKSFVNYYNSEVDPGSSVIPHNTVMDILEDDKGNLLIATLGGLSLYLPIQGSWTHYREEAISDRSLNNNFVNCIYKDHLGNIWLGTERGGVNIFNKSQNIFEHYEFKLDQENGLNHATVNSIFEDSQYLWIGTAGGGLNRYHKRNGSFHHYLHKSDDIKSISGDFITSILRDKNNELWIGTWGYGLNQLKNEGKQSEYFRPTAFPLLPNEKYNFVSCISEAGDDGFWIGTLGGVMYYNKNSNQFKSLFNTGKHKISEVGCILLDSQVLWVGTRQGLYKILNPLSEQPGIELFTHDPENKSSLSGNYVISILKDTRGNLWFGTYGNGLNRYDKDKKGFITYTTEQGLSNNIVYTIEQGPDGNIWMSTDYGLSMLNPITEDVSNYYANDGLLNNQYYWSASFKNEQGKLYFGGMNGMDAFYPHWINRDQYMNKVVITDLKLMNDRVVTGREYNGVKVLSEDISQAHTVELSHKVKMISFEFSALNFIEADKLRYAYILEGFENDWNYVSSERRFANYTNLTPGDYVFKVKVSDSSGEFNSPPKEIAINIHTPFWQTIWFQILALVGCFGLILGYLKWRMYSLKKQKIVLKKKVDQRTQKINQQNEALAHQAIQLKSNYEVLKAKQELIEGQNKVLGDKNLEILHQRDELIDLNEQLEIANKSRLSFFTNVSHEFKTPLTLIIGPIEKLIYDKNLSGDALRAIKTVHRNAKRMLHLIEQILNVRRIDKAGSKLKLRKVDINSFCSEIYQNFEPLASLKGVDFTFEEGDLPGEIWFDTEKLSDILYNLLSNAFKYTPDGGKISFSTNIVAGESNQKTYGEAQNSGNILIRVHDNGIGISEENIPLVFDRFYRIDSDQTRKTQGTGIGLSLTKELVEAHKGQIFLESALGIGSTFKIQFPTSLDAYREFEIVDQEVDGYGILKQVEFLEDELRESLKNSDLQQTDDEYIYKQNRPSILIVEDNIDLRKFLANRLNEIYNITDAKDGLEGIRKAKELGPELIISDVMMPNMDGLEMCSNIKNHLDTSHIPVILLTAKSTVEDQIGGLEIGADDYLPKPFNFELLLARINNLIESRNKLRMLYLGSSAPNAEDVTTNQRDCEFLERAINIVNNHLDESNFNVKDFVKEMAVSRSLLHKKLSALTNQSTSEFINHIRIQKAAVLLRQNNLNVSEVAYAVGYSDPKYFSRLFHKYLGQSPKVFSQKRTNPIDQ